MTSPDYTFRKLRHLYEVHERYTAGVMLEGWETKSLTNNGGDINTAHCAFRANELKLVNAKMTPNTTHATSVTIGSERRDRSLLLNKSELRKIREKLQVKGFTCVPVRLYRNERRLWKLEIALVTGKKLWDKRDDIKKRDVERQMRRND